MSCQVAMGKHIVGGTNQKLYFARVHLDEIRRAQEDDTLLNRKLVIRANTESALFHLYCAYQSLLWEIANAYDVTMESHLALVDLLAIFQKANKVSAELNQLSELEKNPGSWLSAMLLGWSRVRSFDQAKNQSTASASASLNAIAVCDISEDSSLKQLEQWHQELRMISEHFRGFLEEW
jgi:hypothetical protein